ncbi:MAG: hypothetical protein NZ480_06975 [Bdellovibrionaceae bacterium]|nr:hypothetical protein [Pseudobdellovibrionaceae bacterium]MDW8191261.1 hypothetical protein [Pseudobdellovibrionaceae bacterium]
MLLFFSLVFFISKALGAASSNVNVLPFFRSPQSSIPSGYTTYENLKKNYIKSIEVQTITAEKDDNYFQLNKNQFIDEMDLSQKAIDLSSSRLVTILKCSNTYCTILDQINLVNRPRQQLIPWFLDKGRIVMWRNSHFIEEKSKLSHIAERGTFYNVIHFLQQYAYVIESQPPYRVGYVPIVDGISKLDLAQYVLCGNNWLPVQYHNKDGLKIAKSNLVLKPHEVEAFLTYSDKGILTEAIDSHRVLPRSHLKVLHNQSSSWKISFLEQHGEVYWQENAKPTNIVLAQDLLKNPIYSYALAPTPRQLPILVSSNGIYLSHDGLSFSFLEQFHYQNLPVAIDQDLNLYVGNYRAKYSHNPKFEPFFHISHLKHILGNRDILSLQIKNILITEKLIKLDLLIDHHHQLRVQGSRKAPLWSPWFMF